MLRQEHSENKKKKSFPIPLHLGFHFGNIKTKLQGTKNLRIEMDCTLPKIYQLKYADGASCNELNMDFCDI
jgi:hypothetical protein